MDERRSVLGARLRGILFSMLLGFHHALEQDGKDIHSLSNAIRLVQATPGQDMYPELARQFLWGASSMAN